MSRFVILPLLGAFIGWVTNHLAISFLFRPHRPWLGLRWFQGVIPKNRRVLVETVAGHVASDLLSSSDIARQLNHGQLRLRLSHVFAGALTERLDQKLPAFVPLRSVIINEFYGYAQREVQEWLERDFRRLLDELTDRMDVAGVVAAKLETLDLSEVERLVRSVAGRELRVIEVTGAVLGAIIGFIQALLVLWLG
ncbi:MAG: DUF445 family protein [Bacillota bacterium]